MKRIIAFASAFKAEIENATPETKKAICEDAKVVVGLTMSGHWATLALHVITDIEATIAE